MKKNDALKKARLNIGLSQEELAEKLGVKQSYIAAIESNKNFSAKKAMEIAEILGIDWRDLTVEDESGDAGDKKVIKPNAVLVGDFDYPRHPDERVVPLMNGKYSVLVPIIPERGYMGIESGWSDREYVDELPKHQAILTHEPAGEYWACEAVGPSMENWTSEEMAKASIRDGEIVTGRNIDKRYWKSRFHLHKYKNFIIVHEDGILVKRIIAHDVENGNITIHSLNPNKQLYPDRVIELREVKKILNIVDPLR